MLVMMSLYITLISVFAPTLPCLVQSVIALSDEEHRFEFAYSTYVGMASVLYLTIVAHSI